MPEPYMGEIQAFAFNFGSSGFNNGGWLPCDGRLLSISEYSALYALIGTSYGGDGSGTFALPNFNGRVALSQGAGPGLTPRVLGEPVGTNTVTLRTEEMAAHNHPLQLGPAGASGATPGPVSVGATVAINPSFNGFADPPSDTTFASNAIVAKGDSQAHDNVQPTLALWYCICIDGVFPSFN